MESGLDFYREHDFFQSIILAYYKAKPDEYVKGYFGSQRVDVTYQKCNSIYTNRDYVVIYFEAQVASEYRRYLHHLAKTFAIKKVKIYIVQ
jgi:hypothetical protein